MASGERVTTAEAWRDEAAAGNSEVLRDGDLRPHSRQRAEGDLGSDGDRPAARDGAAVMKRVVGRMGDKPDAPRMNLTVHLPAKAAAPVPVLLSISFGFPPGGSRRQNDGNRQKAGARAKGGRR